MSKPSYQQHRLVLKKGPNQGKKSLVKDMQRDLRALGYLRKGIDGKFGGGTERALKALQYDLLNHHGSSTRHDGTAPISIGDFNHGRVTDINGECDNQMAGCIGDLLACLDFPKVPSVDDPRQENQQITQKMAAMKSNKVPVPFLMAILKQESNLQHYNVPSRNDEDTFVVVGLDTNASEKHIITSRGYGAGQYTLFHHPVTHKEHQDYIVDWKKNLSHAIKELRFKFDHFVNGDTGSTQADDRQVEFGSESLRLCKYSADDPRYLRDCHQCAVDVGSRDIEDGVTKLHRGTTHVFKPTQYYRSANYSGVPIRKNFECDWPYAIRRYNGSGINSYHYQARILKNLLRLK